MHTHFCYVLSESSHHLFLRLPPQLSSSRIVNQSATERKKDTVHTHMYVCSCINMTGITHIHNDMILVMPVFSKYVYQMYVHTYISKASNKY